MAQRFIPVAAPVLNGNEKAYVLDCLESTWISSSGKYIEKFEAAFAEFCGVQHALTCSNGTTALHLALLALGIGPGDEVIVPTLTFVATANAVTYCGARPVFADCEPRTWNIDPASLEAKITHRTKGIIVVHLFGHPVDMDAVLAIASRHGLFVVEDAAQAHGAECHGRRVGSMGDIGTFSFFGNKIVSTGEGGMVVTNDQAMADKMRLLKNHGMDPQQRYWHPIVGYNYRMTNVAAAIGLAQLEQVEWQLQRRREVVMWYREYLQDAPGMTWQCEQEWARHVWWMFTVVVDKGCAQKRDQIMGYLQERGIETRPVVHPVHTLPPYLNSSQGESFPIAEHIARYGINLPTWAGLTREDVRYVCDSLLDCCGTA
ncbi:MAG TPA: DegT/DnrJ/EryC1/StrS family aminotransferase [Candidatus Tectomicrobia bacterium]